MIFRSLDYHKLKIRPGCNCLQLLAASLGNSTLVALEQAMREAFPTEAVKKWDWLRAVVLVSLRFWMAARCLSQFFHSLTA